MWKIEQKENSRMKGKDMENRTIEKVWLASDVLNFKKNLISAFPACVSS